MLWQGMRGICRSGRGGCPQRQDAGLSAAAKEHYGCGRASRIVGRGSFRTLRLLTAELLLFPEDWLLCRITMFLFGLSVL